MSAPADPSPPPRLTPVWTPLKQHAVFRMLWLVWLTTNICMWLNDVTAAWLMTTLTTSPVMVALVQTAATFPVFLIGIPSGATADIVDRRRYFALSQFWLAGVATLLCIASFTDALSPALLLVLVFCNGIGLALRWPVFSAIIPELGLQQQLPAGLALNGMAVSISRVVGPILAGAVIAAAGSAYVFLLNAVLSVLAAMLVLRWRHEHKVSVLPAERIVGAIRVGLQYVRQSPVMHVVLLRVTVFFINSISIVALAPLVAKGFPGGGAGSYTLLLASMGVGAISAALLQPRLRRMMTRNRMIRNGTIVYACATLTVALAPNIYIAAPAMLIAGLSWVCVADSLTLVAQTSLPGWVRARGMSIFHIAMMGGSAVGAALWGQVATYTGVHTGLALAGIATAVGLLLGRRYKVSEQSEDIAPAPMWKKPTVTIPVEHDQGPVLIAIDYRIDPARADEFVSLMHRIRRSRLRSGVLSWELFRDLAEPGHFVEHILDESWVEHLRRHERMTATDFVLREQLKKLHIGEAPPVISRYIAEPVIVPSSNSPI